MQKYAKIGEIRAAQRDPSDLGRGSVLWAKVRTLGLNPEAKARMWLGSDAAG